MSKCMQCDEDVVFLPAIGWTHTTLQQLDHEVEVSK